MRLELAKHFSQRRAQGVIDGFREDIRPGRHEMGRNAEGRAFFEPALNPHAGFVDLEPLAQRFEALFDERGEGRGGLMVAVREDEFHDELSFAVQARFDKDAFSQLS